MSSTESKIKALEELVTSLIIRVNSLDVSRKLQSHDDDLAPMTNMDNGDTAWMLAATALVLMMTIPGLGLYYSGMVRVENVLTTVMQSFSITCLITICWLAFGYSLAFGPPNKNGYPLDNPSSHYPYYGVGRLWLTGVTPDSWHSLAPTIPEPVYVTYQLTFAIITAALICGSFADRMKYFPMLFFIFLWHFIVYCPIAHWNWHPMGFLNKAGVLDYAGGNVVHISSGVAGLMSTIVVGNRRGFLKKEFPPHNILLTFMGASLLWVGWFGFNAGSANGASGRAAMAMLATQIATATSSITWVITELIYRKTLKPSVLGMLSGAVGGLVCITPASGYVDYTGAFIIGLVGGPLCFLGAQLKHYLGYDDALDAFGVHAIGGIVGGILTGFFANPNVIGCCGATTNVAGVFYSNTHHGGKQLGVQLYGIVVTAGWSAFASFLILKFVDMTMGLRVSAEDEDTGLDSSIHGEGIVPVETANTVDQVELTKIET